MSHYLCICGGRDFVWNVQHWRFLDCFADGCVGLANGMCPTGADLFARIWWGMHFPNVPIQPFEPDWKMFGKSAGPKRNVEMARFLEVQWYRNHIEPVVIAFPGGRGTLSMINCAKVRGIRVVEYGDYNNSIDPKQLGL